LLAFIDSILAVSVLEKPASDLLKVQDKALGKEILFMANPYEQFCNENLGFILRYLKSTKLGEGIHFFIKNWGFEQHGKYK
jgi:hypothetical protein